jgi:tetratricopeptide (TPR) repeat protein
MSVRSTRRWMVFGLTIGASLPWRWAAAQVYVPPLQPKYKPKPEAQRPQVSEESHQLYVAGMAEYNRSNHEGALALMQQAIRASPGNVSAWYVSAVVLHRKKRYPQALDAYNRTLQLDPQYRKAYADRASLHEAMGNREQAEADRQRFYSMGS